MTPAELRTLNPYTLPIARVREILRAANQCGVDPEPLRDDDEFARQSRAALARWIAGELSAAREPLCVVGSLEFSSGNVVGWIRPNSLGMTHCLADAHGLPTGRYDIVSELGSLSLHYVDPRPGIDPREAAARVKRLRAGESVESVYQTDDHAAAWQRQLDDREALELYAVERL